MKSQEKKQGKKDDRIQVIFKLKPAVRKLMQYYLVEDEITWQDFLESSVKAYILKKNKK